MKLPTNVHTSTTPTLITATVVVEPRVPSGCQILGSICLIDVHLHAVYAKWTAGFWTLPIAVVVSGGVRMVWTDRVEVVVDAPFRTSIVHIEFHISTQEIP